VDGYFCAGILGEPIPPELLPRQVGRVAAVVKNVMLTGDVLQLPE
jgi:hypothetical protein